MQISPPPQLMLSPLSEFFHGDAGEYHQSVVAELQGTLLISNNVFPYFMLVAFEAGGPLRALLLLLLSPLLSLLDFLRLDAAAIHLMTFVSTAGLAVADVKAVAKATLPRFFLKDMSEETYRVFGRCRGKRHVVTCLPRIMVEAFLREYLDVGCVVATEVGVVGERCSGVVAPPGVMVGGRRRREALRVVVGGGGIDVALGRHGVGDEDQSFMLLCRESYSSPPPEQTTQLTRKSYPKPLIFHDGRFVNRPTPLQVYTMLIWLPAAFLLAVLRILVGLLPFHLQVIGGAALGIHVRSKFSPSTNQKKPNCHGSSGSNETETVAYNCDESGDGNRSSTGVVYACAHRTLLDPVITAGILQKKVVAVTYSLSRVSELLSPIPTVRLSRDRGRDENTMRSLLMKGEHLVVCPEGTTCREPYLLRFSPLFAEVATDIVPVAVTAEGSMFYGTTVRGYKWLDSFFFLMNPLPCYRLQFLDKVAGAGGDGGYEVANKVQRAIGEALGFECTNYTRRDKYRMIAGNDGLVCKSE